MMLFLSYYLHIRRLSRAEILRFNSCVATQLFIDHLLHWLYIRKVNKIISLYL